jgi:hypothetical protein
MKKVSTKAFVRGNLKAAIGVRFGSQIAFARALGLHSVKVSRLCRGWMEPTPIEREHIAEALNADADWLFAVVRIPAPKKGAEVTSTFSATYQELKRFKD